VSPIQFRYAVRAASLQLRQGPSAPAGAYVIKNGEVDWRPAVDPNRIVTMVGLVAIAYLLSRPRVTRARAKLRSRRAAA
jgi:hypothetical protein